MRAWSLLTEGSGSRRSASLLLPIRISFSPRRISTVIPCEIETERISGFSAGIIANPHNFSVPSAKGMPESYPIFPEEASLSDQRRGHIPVFPNIREACRILWREVILSVREVHMAWENNDSLFRRLVERSPERTVFSDQDGNIRLWNAGAEAIFGYGAREAVGKSLDIIVPEKMRERHWEGYFRVMKTGVTKYGTDLLAVPGIRKDGSRVSLEFSVALIRDGDGALMGISAGVRDG